MKDRAKGKSPLKKSYPVDLARAIYRQLTRISTPASPPPPSMNVLTDLVEILYFTSFKTEEGQSIACHVIWLNPANPDPNPPPRIRSYRSVYIPLAEPVVMTSSNLVKLSKATDPRTSALTVFPNTEGVLEIHGFIDQGNHHYAGSSFDGDRGILRPGLFQIIISGPAQLIAQFEGVKIAELKADTLITQPLNALRTGPIYVALHAGITRHVQSSLVQTPDEILDSHHFGGGTELYINGMKAVRSTVDWRQVLENTWLRTICRLLIRIQSYGHGGSVLITPTFANLNVKYKLNFSRLRTALERHAIDRMSERVYSDLVNVEYAFQQRDIPAPKYLNSTVAIDQLEDTKAELDATIWCVSLFSRVDGLVLLDMDLNVGGFGAVITCDDDLDSVYLAGDENATEELLTPLNYNHFGTRHRSIMRYCSAHEGAVGFVVSQDGDVRAITSVNNKVVVWDNLMIRNEYFAGNVPVKDLRRRASI